jgi:hypothetical protein
LDFGNLAENASSTKSITITNTGGVNINVKSVVSGDGLFTDNLLINKSPWINFSAGINAGQNQNESVILFLPPGYASSSGKKSGQLIFWATAE